MFCEDFDQRRVNLNQRFMPLRSETAKSKSAFSSDATLSKSSKVNLGTSTSVELSSTVKWTFPAVQTSQKSNSTKTVGPHCNHTMVLLDRN